MAYSTYPTRNINRSGPIINGVFDRFFGDLNAAAQRSPEGRTPTLRVDILENPESYQLIANLPGFKKDELDISINEDVLTLKAEKRSEQKSEEDNGIKVLRSERNDSSYQRKFSLSDNVDTENVSANLEDGVLTLTLPKVAETKPRSRQILVA